MVKSILKIIMFKVSFPESDVIKYFKRFDENFDGKISKQEIIDAFDQVGIDVNKDIDPIMLNLDDNRNGFLEYSELKLVLTDWNKIIKKKTLCKVFQVQNSEISLSSIESELDDITPEEWKHFCSQITVVNDSVTVEALKEFIIVSIQ